MDEDSNEHMMLNCNFVKNLWNEIEFGLLEIGVIEYTIEESTIVLWETSKAYWLIAVHLNTKKVILNAKRDLFP